MNLRASGYKSRISRCTITELALPINLASFGRGWENWRLIYGRFALYKHRAPVISSRSNRVRLIHLCLGRLQEYFHFRLAALPCDAHRRLAGHLNTFVPRDSDINHHANASGKSERAPASDCKGRVTSPPR